VGDPPGVGPEPLFTELPERSARASANRHLRSPLLSEPPGEVAPGARVGVAQKSPGSQLSGRFHRRVPAGHGWPRNGPPASGPSLAEDGAGLTHAQDLVAALRGRADALDEHGPVKDGVAGT
jgi:hypothetical protein